MRRQRINVDDSAVSYFYIFSKYEKYKLATLSRNEEIEAAFETSDCLASFKV